MSAPKFSISIVTYTAVKQARRCIESVLANSKGQSYELILTANGNPEAKDLFRYDVPTENRIVHIYNPTNEGFIKPNNRAFRVAVGDYFITLNDDCNVPDGWLEKLEQPFLSDPKCAITGARGGCYSLDDNFVGYRGERLEYIEGSCMCVKRSVALNHEAMIGLFDEDLSVAYCEDADLSLRYQNLGYTIHLADFALDNHVSGTTASTVPGLSKHAQANFALCRKRWEHYLKTRSFN